ncbi:MAG: adenine phosphoribosyltransferase [bacterium]|nr:MAG: adenine phosphoribosyltransferase [bacterium]
MPKTSQKFLDKIRIVPDFPKKGIRFLDLTTLFNDAGSFSEIIDIFAERYRDKGIDQVVGIESRGFVVASALALKLGCGVTLIRKPGKLPAEILSESYELEYGVNEIQIHKDALNSGSKVLLIDDLLATGGTMQAAIKLVERLGAGIAEVAFIVELGFLNGREKLGDHSVFTLIESD